MRTNWFLAGIGIDRRTDADHDDVRLVSECTNDNCLYGLRRKVIGSIRYRW
jgi:hypothetical protein